MNALQLKQAETTKDKIFKTKILDFLSNFNDYPSVELDKMSLISLLILIEKSVFFCEDIKKILEIN